MMVFCLALWFFLEMSCFASNIFVPGGWRHDRSHGEGGFSWHVENPEEELKLRRLKVSYKDDRDIVDLANLHGDALSIFVDRQDISPERDIFGLTAQNLRILTVASVRTNGKGWCIMGDYQGLYRKELPQYSLGEVNDIWFYVGKKSLSIWKFFGRHSHGSDCGLCVAVNYNNLSAVDVFFGLRDKALSIEESQLGTLAFEKYHRPGSFYRRN